jgi:hypothetical protein
MDSRKPVFQSRSILWIFVPVLFALLIAGIVGLPLFQDGSSYLLEMLIDHSVVRNGRVSILLFQLPTIVLIKTFLRLHIDTLTTLPIVRLAFNLNYAFAPLISLFLSWLVVRKKREELLVWAALIILFVNLVNFSWVSELLIAVQFVCPLLLALLQDPKSKAFWVLFVVFMPFTFFLHPLVISLYVVMAVASAYIGFRQPVHRRSTKFIMTLFLLAAAGRAIYSFFTLSSYELSFVAAGEATNYFVISRVENILFIGTTVELAFLILLSRFIVSTNAWIVKTMFWLVSAQALLLFFFTARFLFRDYISSILLVCGLAILNFLYFWHSRGSNPFVKMQLLYVSFIFLALAASSLLLAQYTLKERIFTLKMGSDLFAILFIMLLAMLDSGREVMSFDALWRFRFVIALSILYCGVVLTKSMIWQTSVHRLEQSLRQTSVTCTEITPTAYRWLESPPYTIINNWAISSLALVIQDRQPRKLLLAQNDCQLYQKSGEVQIDPWSRFSKEYIVPPLE